MYGYYRKPRCDQARSEEHTSELQSQSNLVCRLLLEKKTYSEVAETYKRQASNPLILGLTASPSARKERVQEICDKLAITNVEMRTDEDDDVVKYVNDVTINWERVPLPPAYKEISKILRAAMDERTEKL